MNNQKNTYISKRLRHYTHRSAITFYEDILLRNERIIVPTIFQVEMKFFNLQERLEDQSC